MIIYNVYFFLRDIQQRKNGVLQPNLTVIVFNNQFTGRIDAQMRHSFIIILHQCATPAPWPAYIFDILSEKVNGPFRCIHGVYRWLRTSLRCLIISNGVTATDSKIHGAKMGLIWGRQDPGVPHVGRMNFAIWDSLALSYTYYYLFVCES